MVKDGAENPDDKRNIKNVTGTLVEGAGDDPDRFAKDVFIRGGELLENSDLNLILAAIGYNRSFTHKIINNATVEHDDAAVTYELDLSKYSNFNITAKVGTKTDSPTINVNLQFKDDNGNVITDPDYSSVDISSAGTFVTHKCYLEAYKTAIITVTPSGTGSFAGVTIQVNAKS